MMKRIFALLLAALLLLSGCGNSESVEETPPVTEDTIPVVVPIGERTEEGVKVTIHAGLLGMDTEFLSETQKENGFIAAVRNEDRSITYTISTDAYDAYIQKKYQDTCSSMESTVKDSFGSVTNLSYEPDLSAVTLTVRRNDYEYSVDTLVVFAVGSMVIGYQAYDLEAPGKCVITVVDEEGKQISQNVYPDELVL